MGDNKNKFYLLIDGWKHFAGLRWGFVAWTVLGFFRPGTPLICLSCDAVANPRLCTHVTECFAGEKCGIETFISADGDLQYKLGCVYKDHCSNHAPNTTSNRQQYISCNHCCDSGDLCNVYGCNSTGFPINRGPICFSCESLPKGYLCHKITHCETHEVCFNDAHLEFQTDMTHTSGCRSRHHCASEAVDPEIFMGRRTTSVCTNCCKGDLCNVQCSQTNLCTDDPSCAFLKVSYDVCNTPEIASQFCKKTCNLCATSGMTSCMDMRLDCANIVSSINMCKSRQDAVKYGCMQFCGYCFGTTNGPASITSTPRSTKNNHVSSALPTTATTTGTYPTNSMVPTTASFMAPSTISNMARTTASYMAPTTTSNMARTTASYMARTTASYMAPTTTTIYMAPTTTQTMSGLHIGDLVIRGLDWHGGDQDGNSTGVVVSVIGSSTNAVVVVRWDKTKRQYMYIYGSHGKQEVQLYARATPTPFSSTITSATVSLNRQSTTSMQGTSQRIATGTTTPQSKRLLVKGDLVVKGPDWAWKDQDGNTTGVVTGIAVPGWVTVRWGNGFENSYRYGAGGKYDIAPVNKGYTSGTKGFTSGTRSGTTIGTGIMYSTTMKNTNNNITSTSVASIVALRVGDRVVRGPDWIWGDQDGGGAGTVSAVDTLGWATVKWDNNFVNTYRYGVQNKYDIQKVSPKASTMATTAPPTAGAGLANDMYIGGRVQRGKDWRYGDQDGNGFGTIRDLPPSVPLGWVRVEWDNGYVKIYRVGADQAYDIMFVPGSFNPPAG